jgi:hypothetical protein
LDAIVRCVILQIQMVLPSNVFLLEGQDGQAWKNHVHKCALCHLPHVDGEINPSLLVVLVKLRCMLCG